MSLVSGFRKAVRPGVKIMKRFGQGVLGKGNYPRRVPEYYMKGQERRRVILRNINSAGSRSALATGLVAGTAAIPVSHKHRVEQRQEAFNQEDLRDMNEKNIRKRYASTMASTQPDSKHRFRNATLTGTALGAGAGLLARKALHLKGRTAASIGGAVGSILGADVGIIGTGLQVRKRSKPYMAETEGMTRDQILHHIKKNTP